MRCWCIECTREYLRAYDKKHSKERCACVKAYEATPKGKLATYKKGAKQRGKSWWLSKKKFYAMIGSACYWCGRVGGGVDRLDNRRGYSARNCVPCCGTCNRAKGVLSVKQFIEWVEALSSRLPLMKDLVGAMGQARG